MLAVTLPQTDGIILAVTLIQTAGDNVSSNPAPNQLETILAVTLIQTAGDNVSSNPDPNRWNNLSSGPAQNS
jgi:hypothetical protein